MSNVWFTSDLHIGHTTIAKIRYAAVHGALELEKLLNADPDEYESDVTDWHDNWLAEKWDAKLRPGDVLWVLGDISSGTKSGQQAALQWIQERKDQIYNDWDQRGTFDVHLIAGNHDEVHPMHRDSHKWQPAYLEVFNTVQTFSRRRIPYDSEGHADAFLSHFPYHGDHGKERYVQYRLPDLGRDYIIHGHTHSSKRFSARQLHVGVDAWHGDLVPLETIVAYVNGRWEVKPSAPEINSDNVIGAVDGSYQDTGSHSLALS